jgi:CheY-like chemotaxis protein
MTEEAFMQDRVLIVDDQPDAADTLAQMVNALGYEALAVYDGKEAVQLVATFHPDLVLLDIEMPGFSGYDAVARIRRQRGNAHLIVVAVTGWTRDEDKQRAYESGFDLHVAKPVKLETLQEILALLNPS